MTNNSTSQTQQKGQNDDEDLDELIRLYTSPAEIRAALQQKEESEGLEEIGVLVKNYPTPQQEIDLHGFSVPEALFEMEKFIKHAIQNKMRTVRVITGKGLHSKNMISVMPEEIEKKLSNLRKERKLLAFKRERNGGSFAVYLVS